MDEIELTLDQGNKLKKLLKIPKAVIGIGLPLGVADALGIKAPSRLSRENWQSWLKKLKDAKCVLLWVEPRLSDDQDFYTALGAHLPSGTILWTFHAMGVLTIDRLTGDAVQTLLTSSGLTDKECTNTGFGYYVRGFSRAKGSKAQPVKASATQKAREGELDESDRGDLQRLKAREALKRSEVFSSTRSFKAAIAEDERRAQEVKERTQRTTKKSKASKSSQKRKPQKSATKKTRTKKATRKKTRKR